VKTVQVALGDRSYGVRIGAGILEDPALKEILRAQIAVITDAGVAAQPWFAALNRRLLEAAKKSATITVPAGEGSKSMAVYAQVCSQLAAAGLNRGSVVVALGGGVVGDLAGFAAASYLRGVQFIQIPTTLLAAVDSSVGGKTGINVPEGKNLVGAFYQPNGVWVDADLLKTLPAHEFAAGMAEVIKYGVIRDKALFAQVASGKDFDLEAVIERCVQIKAGIVSADEHETTGERALLNFGHTFGHAIEQSAGYGRLLHGEAVAIGMMGAASLSQQILDFPEEDLEALRASLLANGLPDHLEGLALEQLLPAMGRDKKATAKGLRWILSRGIGQAEWNDTPDDAQMRAAVEVMRVGA
jgi:3-dehydroquinate synthase